MRVFILNKFFRAFPALRHRNYQLYFTGQLISLIGTWLQIVALSWLVLELTHSAFKVSLVSTLSTLPVLFFALFGGVIVDRFDKRAILFFTQSSLLVFALLLGIITISGNINIPVIYTLAFLSGIINALDMPARQSFVIEMVGKESMSSAIALNSGAFSGARVVGPALAGFIITFIGMGEAFILNAISFLAVIIALLFISAKSVLPYEHSRPVTAIKEGLFYSFSHPVIKILLLFAGVSSIFTWGFTSILPFIIQNTFHQGVTSLGYFYGAIGIGSVSATFLVSAFSRKVNPLIFIIGGNFIAGIGLIIFSFTSNVYFAIPLLFFIGFGLIAQFSSINSTIQHLVAGNFRGRVMSIYTLAFVGMLPIGSFQIGILTEKFGTPFAIIFGAIISITFGLYVYLKRGIIKTKSTEITSS